jgi:hypothetical protein
MINQLVHRGVATSGSGAKAVSDLSMSAGKPDSVKGCGCRPVTNVATGSWAGVRNPSQTKPQTNGRFSDQFPKM